MISMAPFRAGLRSPRLPRERGRRELLLMGDFRSLAVWAAARRLAVLTHTATASLPAREQYVLGNQMRRAAVSVASNIAEGAGRGSDREFGRFLRIARGSLHELSTQIVIARDLDLGDAERFKATEAVAAEVGRLLGALIRRLAKDQRPTTKDSSC